MIYIYEFLFTFFLVFFYVSDVHFSIIQALCVMFTCFVAYSLDKNTYLNPPIALTFLFTGYRSFGQVISCIGIQILALATAMLIKVSIGETETNMEVKDISKSSFVMIEFLCSFFMTFFYYSLLIDMKSIKEGAATIAGITLLYGGLQMAFPKLPCGNTLIAISEFQDFALIFLTLLGNVFGSLLGSLLYKFAVCENNELKNKEIQANENNKEVNF